MIPAPIDRPLSRAYLREFTGWSTAYPPGISDPTSLRIMENVQINRDGSCQIRPGLRYVSYTQLPIVLGTDDGSILNPGYAFDRPIVGSHEPFFLNDGSKAYLFAVREVDNTVGFRVLADTGFGQIVHALTDGGIAFTVGGGLNFTAATTYVKYLQIDNKIFALSNAGETMRLFTVGTTKSAKVLTGISRPNWDLTDKLTVVHPDAAWTNSGVIANIRSNLVLNPSFEGSLANWVVNGAASLVSTPTPIAGTTVARLSSVEQRTNLARSPLYNVPGTGLSGWTAGSGAIISVSGPSMGITSFAGTPGRTFYANMVSAMPASAGAQYHAAVDVTARDPGIAHTGMLWRFYDSGGVKIGSDTLTNFTGGTGRKATSTVTAPAGTSTMRLYPRADTVVTPLGGTDQGWVIDDLVVCLAAESTAMFSGASGADYFWVGTTNDSSSVYHPPQNVQLSTVFPTAASTASVSSVYARSSGTARAVSQDTFFLDSGGGVLGTVAGAGVDASGSWTRFSSSTVSSPVNTTQGLLYVTVSAVPRGEFHYVDAAMFEPGVSVLDTYFDGDTADTPTVINAWFGTANNAPSIQSIYSLGGTVPPAETKTANTLISSTASANVYNFGFFYTFSNEVGESAASKVTVVRTQRSWSGWRWETPNAAGEPSGTSTADPTASADQLVAIMPQAVFDAGIAQGALQWNLYMFTWSDQDPVPVSAVKIDTRPLTPGAAYGTFGWGRATPVVNETGSEVTVLPSLENRYNYSEPSRGGQGIIAADRMVMVFDPAAQGVIRWSSNQQGAYTNFTPNKGGGYKTLTSGNLYVPACVKLWQNPQSADTLTILCIGIDGQSTGYYMAPAQVASQSEAVNIMGFEETTATPGTTSPYGVEVFNNALYHPIEEMLMKSTATNYNINHSSLTDQIQDGWRKLTNKHRIVSSVFDNRIYYLVHNPDGETLLPGCFGNEVWVFDGMAKMGSWSRWLTQGVSLRKMEFGGKVGMSLVRPDGIYFFDEAYDRDDIVTGDLTVQTQFIPWKLETNTQGANRAHDAWANLQQVGLSVGNFIGEMHYGVRGLDVNGKRVEKLKVLGDHNDPGDTKFDLEDYLKVQRTMKEWFFFAESALDDEGAVKPSTGQINLVQYKYTPVSVNVGYDYGSIETFEYGRDVALAESNTVNGIPVPMIDTRRP